MNHSPKYDDEVKCLECGTKFYNGTSSEQVFCGRCSRKKCIICKIILSTKYRCGVCKENHCEPHADGQRCKKCGDAGYQKETKRIIP